jgi:hypothetical protein
MMWPECVHVVALFSSQNQVACALRARHTHHPPLTLFKIRSAEHASSYSRSSLKENVFCCITNAKGENGDEKGWCMTAVFPFLSSSVAMACFLFSRSVSFCTRLARQVYRVKWTAFKILKIIQLCIGQKEWPASIKYRCKQWRTTCIYITLGMMVNIQH